MFAASFLTNLCYHDGMKHSGAGASGAVYGLGFIGALFYFIQHAHTFIADLYGILQALVWPAIIVYKLLQFFRV